MVLQVSEKKIKQGKPDQSKERGKRLLKGIRGGERKDRKFKIRCQKKRLNTSGSQYMWRIPWLINKAS